jgi:membrane protein implicated in regulation of membrane protease activity
VFFVWYGVVRFVLESLRTGNWTFYGIPTAQLVSLAFIAIGVVGLAWRHRRQDREPDQDDRTTDDRTTDHVTTDDRAGDDAWTRLDWPETDRGGTRVSAIDEGSSTRR